MRLIDADKLFEDIQQTITEWSSTIDWLKLIDQQPAAYDPGKVVEQIKSAKDEDNMVCYINNKPVIEKSKAIEIVKGGGIK